MRTLLVLLCQNMFIDKITVIFTDVNVNALTKIISYIRNIKNY